MESTTPLSSTKKPRWRRGLDVVQRRPSRVFGELNIQSSSPTPSERGHSSDSISTERVSTESSPKPLSDTVAAFMESTTSLSSTKKPLWRRGLAGVRRRPSRVFGELNIQSSSPTPSERGHSSDSISTEKVFTGSSPEPLSDTVAAFMESTTSLSSTKKPRWRRGLDVVRRRPSRVFGELNIPISSSTPSERGHSSDSISTEKVFAGSLPEPLSDTVAASMESTPSEREHSSDSISTKGFSKASSLEILPDTVAALPPAAAGNMARSHSASDLKGENTKREAVPLSEPGGHGMLTGGMFAASPENTLELPIITKEIASGHAPPAATEQLVLTSEPEEMMTVPETTLRPTDVEELVQTHATKTPHGIEEPAGQHLVYVTDTPSKLALSDAAVPVEYISASHSETPVPEAALSGEHIGTSPIEAISYFNMPPQENTTTGISAETSYESLAAPMVGRGHDNENAGCRQEKWIVL
jgi:hypothetical protein